MAVFLGLLTLLAPSASAQTVVDFDAVSTGCSFVTGVTPGALYAGVTFSGNGMVLDECGNFGVTGHSAPNFLAFNAPAGFGGPQTLTFDPPVSTVTVRVGSNPVGTLTGTAYDAGGAVIDSVSLPTTGALQSATFTGPANLVTVVVENTADAWVLDDLEFDTVFVLADDDGDGFTNDVDCDDADPLVNPAAAEVCDGVDNDCDGALFPGEADADADGFLACIDDCNDFNPTAYPGAPEVCDGADNDCDGVLPADEGDADLDGSLGCEGDCDDADPVTYPGAPELCDGLDNDCDGVVQGGEADDDGDGVRVCEGDCDDTRDWTYPGATEVCDGLDNDCGGSPDADELDADDDGFRVCEGDCDDANRTVYPGADDPDADGVDQDCDGVDGLPATGTGGTGTGGTGTGTGTGDAGPDPKESGCGCASVGGVPGVWWVLPVLAGLRRRR